MKTQTVIELDGSHHEGGGGLVRTALQMSALTQLPVRLTQIRGGTNHPGLDLEDVQILRLLSKACDAETDGAEISSHELMFTPRKRLSPITESLSMGKKGARGANALIVLATLLPILARGGGFSEVSTEGETFGPNTLTFDYFSQVGLTALRKMGIYAWLNQLVAGFGRDHYGKVAMEVEPSAFEGLNWQDRGRMVGGHAIITTSELPTHVFARGKQHLENLAHFAGVPLRISHSEVKASSPGAAVTLWAEFERGIGGVVQSGSRGIRIETVAQGAFEGLSDFLQSSASVDSHLCDLLLVPAVFAQGESAFKVPRLTARFLTMVWVVKQFLPIHLTIIGDEGQPGAVSVRPG